jgi:hypothetical protein
LLRFLPGHVFGQTTLSLGLVKLIHEAPKLVGMCQELIENASGQNGGRVAASCHVGGCPCSQGPIDRGG